MLIEKKEEIKGWSMFVDCWSVGLPILFVNFGKKRGGSGVDFFQLPPYNRNLTVCSLEFLWIASVSVQ